jgi:hypothetical protein
MGDQYNKKNSQSDLTNPFEHFLPPFAYKPWSSNLESGLDLTTRRSHLPSSAILGFPTNDQSPNILPETDLGWPGMCDKFGLANR